MKLCEQHLAPVFGNVRGGRATTLVLPMSQWEAAEQLLIGGLHREVALVRSGQKVNNVVGADHVGVPMKVLYRAINEGVVAIIRLEGVNGPLMDLLAQLTNGYEPQRGEIHKSETRFFLGFPDVTIHESFNFIVLVDPVWLAGADRYVAEIKRILTGYTCVVEPPGLGAAARRQ